jgi:hypothetical protein
METEVKREQELQKLLDESEKRKEVSLKKEVEKILATKHEHDWVVEVYACCRHRLRCADCDKLTKEGGDGKDLYGRGFSDGDHVYLDEAGVAQRVKKVR